MAATLPNEANLNAAMRRADEERALWDAHRTEYTRLYPDQFVAVRNGELVDHDPDLMLLVQRLRANGLDVGDLSVQFMASSQHRFLL